MSVSHKLVSPHTEITIIDKPMHVTFVEIEGDFVILTTEEPKTLKVNDVEIRQILRKAISL